MVHCGFWLQSGGHGTCNNQHRYKWHTCLLNVTYHVHDALKDYFRRAIVSKCFHWKFIIRISSKFNKHVRNPFDENIFTELLMYLSHFQLRSQYRNDKSLNEIGEICLYSLYFVLKQNKLKQCCLSCVVIVLSNISQPTIFAVVFSVKR